MKAILIQYFFSETPLNLLREKREKMFTGMPAIELVEQINNGDFLHVAQN